MKFTTTPNRHTLTTTNAFPTFNALIIIQKNAIQNRSIQLLQTIFKHLQIVSTAHEALTLTQYNQFDAIYVDLDDIDSIEFIKRIKNNDPQKLLIVLTSGQDTQNLFSLIQMEIFYFIAKPIVHEHLSAITHSIIAYLMEERYYNSERDCIKKDSCKLNEETKLNEQLLIQQQKMGQMGEMMSMIAHQWRQPLSAITTIIGALRMKMSLDYYKKKEHPLEALQQELAGAFDKIEHSATFLSNTINDFRNFYSPNKPKSTFEVSEMIERIAQMALADKGLHNIQLQLELAKEIKIYTYENELMQVILNLLNNAKDAIIEHHIENPFIRIILNANEHQILISVLDNAGGIPDEMMPKLFDPYFSTKKQKNGTGLGLYMSKTIIQTHLNGSITVQNDVKFHGARFEITLPRTAEGNIR